MNFEYSFEKLSEKIKVCTTSSHKFGTDAFLLANFAAPLHKDKVCDLGTGCGIIPLVLERDFSPKMIYGVDIQPQAIEQFELSIKKSGLSDKLFSIHEDLKNLKGKLPFTEFDVVTCNPPYKASNAGILSELTVEQIARHEVLCNIQDVCDAANKLLKFGGRLCICQRPERLADVITAMRNAGIEPKKLRFVSKLADTKPWLFLIEGKKGSKPFMNVEPTLIIQEQDGFSRELLKIYGKA
ncbi:MAG: putative O-methyltransferase [Oscillospiraceae bacterium]|nr:putative O-methyltransferase [Oscillospiraceae bacterium]